MIELWKMCGLDEELSGLIEKDGGLYTAHGAEGPGGFIEGCVNICKKKGIEYKGGSAITLYSDEKSVPGWKKSHVFLKKNPEVHINYGYDESGNIMNVENINYFVGKMEDDFGVKAHLYTADGGFDFSDNYGAQERSVFKLLLAEVLLGLKSLQKGGVMIIKCFDTTEAYTVELLYCISSLFRTFGIVKPNTSRVANAERYIIGKGYVGYESGTGKITYDFLMNVFETMEDPSSFLNNPIEKEFKQMLYDIQQKIEMNEYINIHNTIALIEKNDASIIRSYIRLNVIKSLEWCEEHEEEVNSLWKGDKVELQIIQESVELMNLLHPEEKHKTVNVKKNVSWFVKSDKDLISFEDFGKRRIKKEDLFEYV
jgi:hypothetical protein